MSCWYIACDIVDNHLLRVYTKLAIYGCTELRVALRTLSN